MKKFFGEFKKFITRGNVLDLAVGVIVGSAFTAIVTALTDKLLKPLINALIYVISGSNDPLAIYTILVKGYTDGQIDLTKSIYIDWGAFINAIFNFLIVALILFLIVRAVNKMKDNDQIMKNKVLFNKQVRKEMKEQHLDYKDKKQVKEYETIVKERIKLEEEKKKLEEEEKKKDLPENVLKEIRDLLKEQKK